MDQNGWERKYPRLTADEERWLTKYRFSKETGIPVIIYQTNGQPEIRTGKGGIVGERIRRGAMRVLTAEQLASSTFDTHTDFEIDRTILAMSRELTAWEMPEQSERSEKITYEDVPNTWWDHFKHDHWQLCRWLSPPTFRRIQKIAVYNLTKRYTVL